MSNRNTHTWQDDTCTGCGIERKTIATEIRQYNVVKDKVTTKNVYSTKYYKGLSQLRYLPKCSGQFTTTPKQRKPIKYKRKRTGERDLHLEIWAEHPHVCFVTGEPLGPSPLPIYFAHVLSKGSYPRYRLKKENIVLMAPRIHYQYDFGTTINDLRFDGVNKLKQKLITEYYAGL